jgi:hypothetical protein
VNPPKHKTQSQHSPGIERIAGWSGYESFRTTSLVFLVVLNCVIATDNIGFILGSSFAPVLAVVCILLVAGGIYWAIQFTEDAQKHFQRSAVVQQAFTKAPEALVSGASWQGFFRTIDGWLFGLTVAQLALMLVQLWRTLHG